MAQCSSARFKTLHVPSRQSIRGFVQMNNLVFKAGKGFYQLVKSETVQLYKQLVVRRKSDGCFYSGNVLTLGAMLNIPTDKSHSKISALTLDDFDVFVQSTSFNRVLDPGTDFLYEVEAMDENSTQKNIKEALKNAKKMLGPPAVPAKTSGASAVSSASASDLIEIVICFDTTGSMGNCIMEVRRRVQEIIRRLLADIPNIRICAYAHGDYCDAHKYVTTYTDFTNDASALCGWVRGVDTTYGGDWEECYELALHEFRTMLSWTPGSQRSIVMIGDANPHTKEDSERKLDWEEELDLLVKQMRARIYSVQCDATGGSILAAPFWKALAERSGGTHLLLSQFSDIIDFIMAICYREKGEEHLQAYEAEVNKRELKKTASGMNQALHALFATLKKGDSLSRPSPPSPKKTASLTKNASLKRASSSGEKPAKKAKIDGVADKSKQPRKPATKAKKPPGVIKTKPGKALTSKGKSLPGLAKAIVVKKEAKPRGRPKTAVVAKPLSKTTAANKPKTNPRGRLPKSAPGKANVKPRGQPPTTQRGSTTKTSAIVKKNTTKAITKGWPAGKKKENKPTSIKSPTKGRGKPPIKKLTKGKNKVLSVKGRTTSTKTKTTSVILKRDSLKLGKVGRPKSSGSKMIKTSKKGAGSVKSKAKPPGRGRPPSESPQKRGRPSSKSAPPAKRRKTSQSPAKSTTRKPSKGASANRGRKTSKSPARKTSKSPARKTSKSPARKTSKSPARKPRKIPARKPSKGASASRGRKPSKSPARKPSKGSSTSRGRKPSKSPARKTSKSPARKPVSKTKAKGTARKPSKSRASSAGRKQNKAPNKAAKRKTSKSPARTPNKKPKTSAGRKPSKSPARKPSKNPKKSTAKNSSKSPASKSSKSPSKKTVGKKTPAKARKAIKVSSKSVSTKVKKTIARAKGKNATKSPVKVTSGKVTKGRAAGGASAKKQRGRPAKKQEVGKTGVKRKASASVVRSTAKKSKVTKSARGPKRAPTSKTTKKATKKASTPVAKKTTKPKPAASKAGAKKAATKAKKGTPKSPKNSSKVKKAPGKKKPVAGKASTKSKAKNNKARTPAKKGIKKEAPSKRNVKAKSKAVKKKNILKVVFRTKVKSSV